MGNLKKLQVDGIDVLPLVSEYETYDSEGNSISDKYANKNTTSSQMVEVSNKITNANNQLTTVSDYVTEVANKYGNTSNLSTNSKDSMVSALNNIYSARDNAKQQIVNALSEKGVTASTSESIESLIKKINTIEVGNDIPEWCESVNNYSNSWIKAASMAGGSATTTDYINGSTYTAAGQNIYFIGGYMSSNTATPLSYVYCYNAVNNTWSTKASYSPGGVAYHAAAYHNNYVYVVGGYMDTTARLASNLHYRYNTSNNSWSSRTGAPYELSYHSYVTIGNYIYAIGGKVGPYGDEANYNVYQYSPSGNTWSTKAGSSASSHVGNYYDVSVALNNSIYVLNTIYEAFELYNPSSNTWTTKTAPPVYSNYHPHVAVLNGNIYAFINGDYDYDGYMASSYNYMYTPSTNTWTEKAKLTTDYVASLDAAVVDGFIYTPTWRKQQFCYIP